FHSSVFSYMGTKVSYRFIEAQFYQLCKSISIAQMPRFCSRNCHAVVVVIVKAAVEVTIHGAMEDAAAESPAFELHIGRRIVAGTITPFTGAAIPIIDAIITVPAFLIDFLVIETVRLAESVKQTVFDLIEPFA